MKFLKALTQKKLSKAIVCGLLVSGSMFVGMGQGFAETVTYIYHGEDRLVPGDTEYVKDVYWVGYSGEEVKITNKVYPGTVQLVDYYEYTYGDIYGSDEAEGIVNIEGGAITDGVYGGKEGHNTITVSGGTLTGGLVGGLGGGNNTITISGGNIDVIYSNIVDTNGGGNTVNLIGAGGKLNGITNNGALEIGWIHGAGIPKNESTLNVAGKNISVGNIVTFQKLKFNIQEGMTYGDTMVNITSSEPTNIENAKVSVIVEAKPQANGDNKTINLLKKEAGTINWNDAPKEDEDKAYTIVVKEGSKLTLGNTKNSVALGEKGTALVLNLAGIDDVKEEPKEEPIEEPIDKPADKPTDKPEEGPTDKPEEGPTDKPTEGPVDNPKEDTESTYSMGTAATTSLLDAIELNRDKLTSGLVGLSENLVARLYTIDFSDKSGAEAAMANVQAAVSGVFQASAVTGVTSTAISVTNNVANLTVDRMSLGCSADRNGGKGVGLMASDSGADVWARYVHGKDKADGMEMDGGSAEYSNNYNGFVVGADFKKVSKFQSGIAFSYVDGSGSNSFNDIMGAVARYGHTDFHTYNFGYYGSIKNDDTNTMFDLSYGTTSADSDTHGLGGAQSFSSKSKIFNAGVTVEKSFDVSGMKLVPYTGLRYMRVDGGEYTDSLGIHHNANNQNVFMLPVGFKLSKENKLSHGWTVTPQLDLSYTWNMGDTDSKMTVSVPGLEAKSNLGYSVIDNGSFRGVAGVEAHHKNWSYGVSYVYQKGSHQDSKKIIADIKMNF